MSVCVFVIEYSYFVVGYVLYAIGYFRRYGILFESVWFTIACIVVCCAVAACLDGLVVGF